jgi:hypothetical protein
VGSGGEVGEIAPKKVVGLTVLTFEELTTLMADVEAVMNSRPLTPLTEDPKDLDVLTPGMLITGKAVVPLSLLPAPTLKSTKIMRKNPNKKWVHVTSLAEEFWKRWMSEYLTTLQKREKWGKEMPNLKEGDLVLVTDEREPPLKWPIGRILKVCTGNEGASRVALVKTQNREYKRCVHKLRRIPVRTSEDEDAELEGETDEPVEAGQ